MEQLRGSSNELKSVDCGEKTTEYAWVKKNQWKFNPHQAPWWLDFRGKAYGSRYGASKPNETLTHLFEVSANLTKLKGGEDVEKPPGTEIN
ncbi:hypothetical protein AVEN_82042-1 [Araneus ventricosus]|uniref:Uncharacterized protein n=1 Tax=Araneus ventricosus TaxID=182803 RepID=A0A4Y2KGZ9_ARAVE|nr:hypothetical protein AVEN_82042-1 [Araneus ventricosus]